MGMVARQLLVAKMPGIGKRDRPLSVWYPRSPPSTRVTLAVLALRRLLGPRRGLRRKLLILVATLISTPPSLGAKEMHMAAAGSPQDHPFRRVAGRLSVARTP